MDVYKIYTNNGNHAARGSLLSDIVITKIPTTVGGRVFALGWLITGTNCTKHREYFLHIVAQETIYLNAYFGVLESNAHPDFEGDIWLKKVRIIFA